MDIRAAEISAILKDQIKNFGQEAEVSEVGQVLSVGDGIARVYGLGGRSWPARWSSFRAPACAAMAFNLEDRTTVGLIVIFGDYKRHQAEGDDRHVRTGALVAGTPVRRGSASVASSIRSGKPMDGKGPVVTSHLSQARRIPRALACIPNGNRSIEPMADGHQGH